MNTTYAQRQTTAQKKDAPSASSVLDASSQSESLQRKADMVNSTAQRVETPRPNNTGMPDNLKAGIESLSGFSMDDVRVHYNSSKPATVQALAYTQGTDIHVAPGQEKHLPHEAWHVAQQMAGRVSPTTNINGMLVNDNATLEHEADIMGEKAVQCKMVGVSFTNGKMPNTTVQRMSFYSPSLRKYIQYEGDEEVAALFNRTLGEARPENLVKKVNQYKKEMLTYIANCIVDEGKKNDISFGPHVSVVITGGVWYISINSYYEGKSEKESLKYLYESSVNVKKKIKVMWEGLYQSYKTLKESLKEDNPPSQSAGESQSVNKEGFFPSRDDGPSSQSASETQVLNKGNILSSGGGASESNGLNLEEAKKQALYIVYRWAGKCKKIVAIDKDSRIEGYDDKSFSEIKPAENKPAENEPAEIEPAETGPIIHPSVHGEMLTKEFLNSLAKKGEIEWTLSPICHAVSCFFDEFISNKLSELKKRRRDIDKGSVRPLAQNLKKIIEDTLTPEFRLLTVEEEDILGEVICGKALFMQRIIDKKGAWYDCFLEYLKEHKDGLKAFITHEMGKKQKNDALISENQRIVYFGGLKTPCFDCACELGVTKIEGASEPVVDGVCKDLHSACSPVVGNRVIATISQNHGSAFEGWTLDLQSGAKMRKCLYVPTKSFFYNSDQYMDYNELYDSYNTYGNAGKETSEQQNDMVITKSMLDVWENRKDKIKVDFLTELEKKYIDSLDKLNSQNALLLKSLIVDNLDNLYEYGELDEMDAKDPLSVFITDFNGLKRSYDVKLASDDFDAEIKGKEAEKKRSFLQLVIDKLDVNIQKKLAELEFEKEKVKVIVKEKEKTDFVSDLNQIIAKTLLNNEVANSDLITKFVQTMALLDQKDLEGYERSISENLWDNFATVNKIFSQGIFKMPLDVFNDSEKIDDDMALDLFKIENLSNEIEKACGVLSGLPKSKDEVDVCLSFFFERKEDLCNVLKFCQKIRNAFFETSDKSKTSGKSKKTNRVSDNGNKMRGMLNNVQTAADKITLYYNKWDLYKRELSYKSQLDKEKKDKETPVLKLFAKEIYSFVESLKTERLTLERKSAENPDDRLKNIISAFDSVTRNSVYTLARLGELF